MVKRHCKIDWGSRLLHSGFMAMGKKGDEQKGLFVACHQPIAGGRRDTSQCLMRRRGEVLERSFAHVLGTGGMRRTHLRFHYNIAKRMLIHVAGFNLGLLMRKHFGVGTPRGLQGRLAAALAALVALLGAW